MTQSIRMMLLASTLMFSNLALAHEVSREQGSLVGVVHYLVSPDHGLFLLTAIMAIVLCSYAFLKKGKNTL